MKTLLIALLLVSTSAVAQNYYPNGRSYNAIRDNPVGKEISEGRSGNEIFNARQQRIQEVREAIQLNEIVNGTYGHSRGSRSGYDRYDSY